MFGTPIYGNLGASPALVGWGVGVGVGGFWGWGGGWGGGVGVSWGGGGGLCRVWVVVGGGLVGGGGWGGGVWGRFWFVGGGGGGWCFCVGVVVVSGGGVGGGVMFFGGGCVELVLFVGVLVFGVLSLSPPKDIDLKPSSDFATITSQVPAFFRCSRCIFFTLDTRSPPNLRGKVPRQVGLYPTT